MRLFEAIIEANHRAVAGGQARSHLLRARRKVTTN